VIEACHLGVIFLEPQKIYRLQMLLKKIPRMFLSRRRAVAHTDDAQMKMLFG